MKAKPLPSAKQLRALFRYDRKSGLLHWRPRRDASPAWNGRRAGREAGCTVHGRRIIGLEGYGMLMASRVIWKMAQGSEPDVVDTATTTRSTTGSPICAPPPGRRTALGGRSAVPARARNEGGDASRRQWPARPTSQLSYSGACRHSMVAVGQRTSVAVSPEQQAR